MDSEKKGRIDGESERGVVYPWRKKKEREGKREREREREESHGVEEEKIVMLPDPINHHNPTPLQYKKGTQRPTREFRAINVHADTRQCGNLRLH